MEYLQGQTLLAWCQSAAATGHPAAWADEFRAALYDTLALVRLFHQHGIILIDFKPDNVIRLFQGGVKFIDLGAYSHLDTAARPRPTCTRRRRTMRSW